MGLHGLRFHDLRDTTASLFIAHGGQPKWAPEVYFDPDEFRDAHVRGDQLTIHVGENVEITFEPALDPE